MRKEGSEREEAETNETCEKTRASESQSQGRGRDSRDGKGDMSGAEPEARSD